MRIVESKGIDLRNPRTCLICCKTELQGRPQKLGEPEAAPPRWQCPNRSGFLTWLFLLTTPSAIFFALIAPLLAGKIPAGILVAGTALSTCGQDWQQPSSALLLGRWRPCCRT